MAVLNPSALHILVPDYPLDQIIGYFAGSMAVGTSGSPPNTIVNLPHGFGDSCYFQGIFSSDNGATWNDFGSEIPNTSSSLPVFQTINCNATIDTTNVNIYGINYTTSAVTILYKIYLLAKNSMAKPVNPLPTQQILSFSSGFNFQRIAYKGSLSLSVASGSVGSASFIHNLGYVPTTRVFCYLTTAPTTVLPIIYDADPNSSVPTALGGGISSTQVRITATTLTLFIDNSSPLSGGTISMNYDYRIYL